MTIQDFIDLLADYPKDATVTYLMLYPDNKDDSVDIKIYYEDITGMSHRSKVTAFHSDSERVFKCIERKGGNENV